MKALRNFLLLALLGGTPLAASAQSTGGGGGGDRPAVMNWDSKGPLQVDANGASCEQLQKTLRVFGKLRVNHKSASGKPIYDIVGELNQVRCSENGGRLRTAPYRVKTKDGRTCSLGYICEGPAWGG
jgi:hypothetical protein